MLGKSKALCTLLSSRGPQVWSVKGYSPNASTALTSAKSLSSTGAPSGWNIQAAGTGKLEKSLELGVSHLLEGKVRRAQNKVRVSVQLTKTDDGYQVWGQKYDRDLHDIFAVQDEITRHVINALKVNFEIGSPDHQVIGASARNVDANTLYLKGMYLWRRRNPEDVVKAVDAFNAALILDPGYATAKCALSQCYTFLGSCSALPPADAYAKALQYAMTAIEKNPDLAEAHLAIANLKFYYFRVWEGARKSYEQAEKLGLNSAMMHQSYGMLYAANGAYDMAI